MDRRHAPVDVRVVDLGQVLIGLPAQVGLDDPYVPEVVDVLVLRPGQRHGPRPHREPLLVLLLVTDEHNEGEDGVVPLHQPHHEVHAQVDPLDDQGLPAALGVVDEVAEVLHHHLALGLVAADHRLPLSRGTAPGSGGVEALQNRPGVVGRRPDELVLPPRVEAAEHVAHGVCGEDGVDPEPAGEEGREGRLAAPARTAKQNGHGGPPLSYPAGRRKVYQLLRPRVAQREKGVANEVHKALPPYRGALRRARLLILPDPPKNVLRELPGRLGPHAHEQEDRLKGLAGVPVAPTRFVEHRAARVVEHRALQTIV
mmetsp:Transcript_1097/g.3872  ORF Transcript_1097/g.3872 Transcript_1097/m.3872 type:complete len:313 (-) Transcript_1097:64-1002(-)